MYSTSTKELSISLFMFLESLNLDKSKWYFVEMNLKKISLLQMLMYIDIVT